MHLPSSHVFTVVQVFAFTRATLSGRPLRLDFVGKLEQISEDWARLQPLLEVDACKLSPKNRRNLILPHVESNEIEAVIKHRSSSRNFQFIPLSVEEGHPQSFTQLHVILICRRFIQDMVCFDLKIPNVCIQYPELIFDLDPFPDAEANARRALLTSETSPIVKNGPATPDKLDTSLLKGVKEAAAPAQNQSAQKKVVGSVAPFSTMATPALATEVVRSWEMPRCTEFWGKPPPRDRTPIVREIFSLPRELNDRRTGGRGGGVASSIVNPALSALMSKTQEWPPADRGSVDDFFSVVGGRRSPLEPYEPRSYSVTTAKIDHVMRMIVVKILKAGSSTLDHLFDPAQQSSTSEVRLTVLKY